MCHLKQTWWWSCCYYWYNGTFSFYLLALSTYSVFTRPHSRLRLGPKRFPKENLWGLLL